MNRDIVFISYPHEDAIIAERLMSAVLAIPGNKFEIFLDRNYICGGQNIPVVIREALRRTVYFVAIGTDEKRRNFDWCGQELGFYQGSHPDGDRVETSLYQTTIPGMFSEIKCFRVQPLLPSQRDEFGGPVIKAAESEFHDFLADLAAMHAKVHPTTDLASLSKVSRWAERWAMELTDAFFEASQHREKATWYPQGRIALSVAEGELLPADRPLDPARRRRAALRLDVQHARAGRSRPDQVAELDILRRDGRRRVGQRHALSHHQRRGRLGTPFAGGGEEKPCLPGSEPALLPGAPGTAHGLRQSPP